MPFILLNKGKLQPHNLCLRVIYKGSMAKPLPVSLFYEAFGRVNPFQNSLWLLNILREMSSMYPFLNYLSSAIHEMYD